MVASGRQVASQGSVGARLVLAWGVGPAPARPGSILLAVPAVSWWSNKLEIRSRVTRGRLSVGVPERAYGL